MKPGDKVKLINTQNFNGHPFLKQFKKGGIYEIKKINDGGGLIFEGMEHPKNMHNEDMGISMDRFIVVEKKPRV